MSFGFLAAVVVFGTLTVGFLMVESMGVFGTGSAVIGLVALFVWSARGLHRRTPASVAVKRASVELVYRDGARVSLLVGDLRVEFDLGTIRLWDDQRAYLIEPGAFISREENDAFTRELSALVGYDISNPSDNRAHERADQSDRRTL